jgi:hypothetical protein
LWYQLKVLEFSIFTAWLYWQTRKAVSKNIIYSRLGFLTLIFQGLTRALPIQQSEDHFLTIKILGETNLRNFARHRQRLNFINEEKIHAYGTTAHPNILAGFCAVLSE